MEVELTNIQKATSSDYWSLASNQYPCGKFPKVSVGITIPRASSVSRGRDAASNAAFERNLSQGTDGRSRPPKMDNASLRVSPEAANHDGSVETVPKPVPAKVSVSQPDDNALEQTGTFSFGTRREQDSHLNQLDRPPLVSSQGKRQMESADKNKPNSEVLRMKLWEILGGASQNKEAVSSPNPEDIETPCQPKSQTANGPSLGRKQVFTSPVPYNIKTPAQLNSQTANKPSSDPIESDSDSPQVVEVRPITRSLGRKKAPAASTHQDKSGSAKKPLSTHRSTPKQKVVDNVFAFNDKCTPKTVGKSAIGDSGSLRNRRSSSRKAKIEPKKARCSDRISDKTTQDGSERKVPSKYVPSENKGEKANSFSSLSRAGKTAESCSRSPKREIRVNMMANVGPRKMQFTENLPAKTLNDGEHKPSSPQLTSLKNKGKCSSISPRQKEKDNTHVPEASDRTAGGDSFNSTPSGGVNPSPVLKKYSWERDASPEIYGKFVQKDASPLADRFRDMPDDFASPTFAANIKISPQRSKMLDDDLFSSKYPKRVNRSRSTSYASDPEFEPLDEMEKTNELPGSESPISQEEGQNRKQPSLSPLSPIDNEGAQSSIPSFRKGYKSHKWLSDVDSPDKSSLEHMGQKSHLKDGRKGKRQFPSSTPFANSDTQETAMLDKEPEQCPENYLTRAFDQLVVVLGRFQTKIKSETSNKSSKILSATGERIRQHLEGVEGQMQADVDKLVNAGKSKRKRLESTYEEQQEKLRVLHEKFKEEVNQQLLGCKNSLEDFEAYHTELKEVADKQKASHKKLLQNAEKTVGAQLNDAETKIAEIQKRARKRMKGLKYVLKELIAE
ncbi:meiosis-specific protein PAIR3 [Oryza brachyantha]|uniref:Meiosis-specific protein ASY3-like coiled-coil domain-containing protein n=1 Tax=Oryza brachyantha TaxID=4533 RepID=J3N2I2_ORYBR|nr:meiosis-specific protein PAIR3 [Oryza brachyantha]